MYEFPLDGIDPIQLHTKYVLSDGVSVSSETSNIERGVCAVGVVDLLRREGHRLFKT